MFLFEVLIFFFKNKKSFFVLFLLLSNIYFFSNKNIFASEDDSNQEFNLDNFANFISLDQNLQLNSYNFWHNQSQSTNYAILNCDNYEIVNYSVDLDSCRKLSMDDSYYDFASFPLTISSSLPGGVYLLAGSPHLVKLAFLAVGGVVAYVSYKQFSSNDNSSYSITNSKITSDTLVKFQDFTESHHSINYLRNLNQTEGFFGTQILNTLKQIKNSHKKIKGPDDDKIMFLDLETSQKNDKEYYSNLKSIIDQSQSSSDTYFDSSHTVSIAIIDQLYDYFKNILHSRIKVFESLENMDLWHKTYKKDLEDIKLFNNLINDHLKLYRSAINLKQSPFGYMSNVFVIDDMFEKFSTNRFVKGFINENRLLIAIMTDQLKSLKSHEDVLIWNGIFKSSKSKLFNMYKVANEIAKKTVITDLLNSQETLMDALINKNKDYLDVLFKSADRSKFQGEIYQLTTNDYANEADRITQYLVSIDTENTKHWQLAINFAVKKLKKYQNYYSVYSTKYLDYLYEKNTNNLTNSIIDLTNKVESFEFPLTELKDLIKEKSNNLNLEINRSPSKDINIIIKILSHLIYLDSDQKRREWIKSIHDYFSFYAMVEALEDVGLIVNIYPFSEQFYSRSQRLYSNLGHRHKVLASIDYIDNIAYEQVLIDYHLFNLAQTYKDHSFVEKSTTEWIIEFLENFDSKSKFSLIPLKVNFFRNLLVKFNKNSSTGSESPDMTMNRLKFFLDLRDNFQKTGDQVNDNFHNFSSKVNHSKVELLKNLRQKLNDNRQKLNDNIDYLKRQKSKFNQFRRDFDSNFKSKVNQIRRDFDSNFKSKINQKRYRPFTSFAEITTFVTILKRWNLPHNASKSDVKSTYRQLVKMFHPDVLQDKDSTQKFLIIKEEYEFLMKHFY